MTGMVARRVTCRQAAMTAECEKSNQYRVNIQYITANDAAWSDI